MEREPEPEELDCYAKESALYDSESYVNPGKDFRQVTLSTFSTQKNHSDCTTETGLKEVQMRSPTGRLYETWEPCWASLHLAVAARGPEHMKDIKKDLVAERMHTYFSYFILLSYWFNVYN